MKYYLTVLVFSSLTSTALASDTYVSGYARKNGTYVQPQFRSKANNNTYDNYSSQGNANPYSGNKGTVNPYQNNNNLNQPSHNYGQKNKKGW